MIGDIKMFYSADIPIILSFKTKCMKIYEGNAMNKIQSNKEDDDKSKKAAPLKKTTAKPKPKKQICYTKNDFKCHECEFVCKKKVTLNKLFNIKHGVKTVPETSSFECLICEDKFKTKSEFLKHKEDTSRK